MSSPSARLALAVGASAAALALSACGSREAAALPSRASAHVTSTPTPPPCPNPEGGKCLGSLAPGTYTTKSFAPAITYTVPAGWTNNEDLPGNFHLGLNGDNRYIGIYQNANAPWACEEHPDLNVSQSVSAYTRWLRRNPLLHVTRPTPVSIGGFHGVFMDISKAPGTPAQGCTFGEFTGAVPFIVGGRGPASLHHVIPNTPGFTERLFLLRYKQGNVAIEIGPEGASLPKYLAKVAPILRSLRFTKD